MYEPPVNFFSTSYLSKHKPFVYHLYNVGPTSKTLADVVQMLYKCFVFAGIKIISTYYQLIGESIY